MERRTPTGSGEGTRRPAHNVPDIIVAGVIVVIGTDGVCMKVHTDETSVERILDGGNSSHSLGPHYGTVQA